MERNLVEPLERIISDELIKIKDKPVTIVNHLNLILPDWLHLERAPMAIQISS